MPIRANRRSFLKNTLLGGTSLLVLRDSKTALGYRANDKLNIASIGVAGMGGGNLGNVSSETIVALCDVHESRMAKAIDKHPRAKRFRDFRRMLDDVGNDIDAVVVSTPDHTHAVAAVAAMNMDKHVYCEKPLAKTVFEARVMRETAAARQLVTQTGNQGSVSNGLRRAVELAWAGTIGDIREAHVWFGGGNGPMQRPTDTPSIPGDLDWDLWLGPAPYRPYHPAYVPAKWRSWRDFGSGGLGDMGCHTVNTVFRALRLEQVWNPDTNPSPATLRISGEASEVDAEGYPGWMQVCFDVPARGDLPPVKLTLHTGGKAAPAELLLGREMTKWGALLCGEKGAIFSDCPWNTRYELLPKNDFEGFQGPDPTLPRPKSHHVEWIEACKGRGKTFSSFQIGGPLTELIQLANVAATTGEPFEYDTLQGKILNSPNADERLHRSYRAGWSL